VYFEIACKFYQKITVNKTQFPEMQFHQEHLGKFNDIDTDLTSFWKEVFRRYEDRRHNADQPILPPDENLGGCSTLRFRAPTFSSTASALTSIRGN
jgi:hypothetical protein